MPKMLIIEDDADAADKLRQLMEPHGWSVELAGTGRDGLQLLEGFKYDFILLDWNLPDLTGLEVCRKYRHGGGETPIIFLTGRGEIESRESGLDAGGDDYLVKPYDIRELLARIRSIQRRPPVMTSGKLTVQGVELDTKKRIAARGPETTQLSRIECNLLEFLFRNPNAYFSAAQLFEANWDSDAESSEATVRVHMTVLRRKLALIGAPQLIKTLRGSGYIVEVAQ
jgi:OmpR-family two-component system manganese-sensing response regulator